MKYGHILEKVYNQPWMITQEGLENVLSILERRLEGVTLSAEELSLFADRNKADEIAIPDRPSIAILPVQGTIFPKANLMTSLSGATSMDKLKSDFNMLHMSDNVTGILLDFDTPGGSAEMVQEMSDVIWEARQTKTKPIWGIANGMAASAGYFLMSQCDRCFVTPSGLVGSIGVVATHTDVSEAEKQAGIKRTVLSVGEAKADGHPSIPLTNEVIQRRLELMQETYDGFVGHVARGRGVSVETVLEDYGKGGVFHSKKALERGMVDGVNTIEQVSKLMLDGGTVRKSKVVDRPLPRKEVTMAEFTPEALELLGLSEDATPEEVNAAVAELAARPEKPEVVNNSVTTVLTPEFEEAYPEIAERIKTQAAQVEELRATDRKNSAKLFAGNYAEFSGEKGKTGFGLSALALNQVEDMHLKIADGLVTHEDLKSFLDNVASGTGVVNYKELGSTRGEEGEEVDADSAHEAGLALRRMAEELRIETNESYGDCLSKVMADPKNKSLVDMYQSTRPHAKGGE